MSKSKKDHCEVFCIRWSNILLEALHMSRLHLFKVQERPLWALFMSGNPTRSKKNLKGPAGEIELAGPLFYSYIEIIVYILRFLGEGRRPPLQYVRDSPPIPVHVTESWYWAWSCARSCVIFSCDWMTKQSIYKCCIHILFYIIEFPLLGEL
jgi:hypothetical protein